MTSGWNVLISQPPRNQNIPANIQHSQHPSITAASSLRNVKLYSRIEKYWRAISFIQRPYITKKALFSFRSFRVLKRLAPYKRPLIFCYEMLLPVPPARATCKCCGNSSKCIFMNYTFWKSLVNYITARHGVFVINIYKYISRREKINSVQQKQTSPVATGSVVLYLAAVKA